MTIDACPVGRDLEIHALLPNKNVLICASYLRWQPTNSPAVANSHSLIKRIIKRRIRALAFQHSKTRRTACRARRAQGGPTLEVEPRKIQRRQVAVQTCSHRRRRAHTPPLALACAVAPRCLTSQPPCCGARLIFYPPFCSRRLRAVVGVGV